MKRDESAYRRRLFGVVQWCGCNFGECTCWEPVRWGWEEDQRETARAIADGLDAVRQAELGGERAE